MTMFEQMAYAEGYFGSTAVIAADEKTGEILFATQPAEALFGYNVLGELSRGREGGRGYNVDDLVPDALRDLHRHHRAAYAKEPFTRSMTRDKPLQGRKKDGTLIEVWIGLSAAVVPMANRRCVYATIYLTGGIRPGNQQEGKP